MTNGPEQRVIMEHRGNAIRNWSFVIGIWSFPRLFASAFANNPA